MGVPKRINDVEDEFRNILRNNNYTFLYLMQKENPKACYYAAVKDDKGYMYRYCVRELKSGVKKDRVKNNPFSKENYLNYIKNHHKNIEVEKIDHSSGETIIYYRCNQHTNFGIQTVKSKHLYNKNNLCKQCRIEYVGKCNRTDESEINEWLNAKDCTYICSDFVNHNRLISFICNKHPEKIQKREYSNMKISHTPCLICNKSIKHENIIGSIDDIISCPRFDNESIQILGNYIDDSTKILCNCNYCNHQWYVTPNKLKQGRGCPNCANTIRGIKARKTQEEAQKDLTNKYPKIQLIGEYVNGKKTTRFKCLDCGTEWKAKYNDVYCGNTGCPLCRSSIGEYEISTYLNKWKIKYVRQKTFEDCKYIELLRFDFYLPQYNTVIEYQGEQHYFPVNFSGHWSDEELNKQFEYTQIRDNIKRDYCKIKGIQMVEIPYWDKNRIYEYLDLIR